MKKNVSTCIFSPGTQIPRMERATDQCASSAVASEAPDPSSEVADMAS